jgi:hypothetical protein
MIKEKFCELKKNFSVRGKFFLVFIILNANMCFEQIDFNFLKADKILTFSFREGRWEKRENKKDKDIGYEEINIKEIKEPEEIIEKISKLIKDKNLFPNKYIIFFQKIKEPSYTILCLCEDFYVYKITLDRNLNVKNKELINLTNFFKFG